MTEFKIKDHVRVRPSEGCLDLVAGSEHTVTDIAARASTIKVSGCAGFWNMSRFEILPRPEEIQAAYLAELEAFKAKAIQTYPDLDDDPDMKEAIKIYEKYMADDDSLSPEVFFKEAIKLGRKLQVEGK